MTTTAQSTCELPVVHPPVRVTVVFADSGEPTVHSLDCGHPERRQALTTCQARVLTVTSKTDVAAILYAGAITDSEPLTAEDFADELSIAQCAVRLPHGAPDGMRRWTRQRREQGFTTREHFEAAVASWDHTAECAECGSPGPAVLTDDGWQGSAKVCPEGQRLFLVASDLGRRH